MTVVALVVAGGLTYFIYLAPNDTGSPEDVFRSYVDALGEGDIRTALDYTLGRFLGEEYLDAQAESIAAEIALEGTPTVIIQSIDSRYRTELPQEMIADLDEYVNQLESVFGVESEDCCLLEVNYTVVDGAWASFVDEDTIVVLEVESNWYVAPTVYSL